MTDTIISTVLGAIIAGFFGLIGIWFNHYLVNSRNNRKLELEAKIESQAKIARNRQLADEPPKEISKLLVKIIVTVVVCLGLLSVIVPQYIDYKNHHKVIEAIILLNGAKTPLIYNYENTGYNFLQTTLIKLGVKTHGKYTKNIVAIDDFSLQATMKDDGSDIAGKTVMFSYDVENGEWTCSSGYPNGVDNKYLPTNCR